MAGLSPSRADLVVLRDRATALRFPVQTALDAIGPRRADVGPCPDCGAPLREVVVTTAGPAGDPALWREHPLCVDGWMCAQCSKLRVPRFLEADEGAALGRSGAELAALGHLDDAEQALRRLCNSWPRWAPGRFNLAMLYRHRVEEEEAGEARPLVIAGRLATMESQLRDALHGEGMPVELPAAQLVRVLLRRGADRLAREVLAEVRQRAGLGDDSRAALDELERYIEVRGDRFDDGAAAVKPYLILDGRPRQQLDVAARRRVTGGIESLLQYAQHVPDSWQALWLAAKGHEALGDHEAMARELGRARSLQPGRAEIGREYCKALLNTGRFDEAVEVARAASDADPSDAGLIANLALAQLLAGRTQDAGRSIERAAAAAPGDRITATLAGIIDDVEAGRRPAPRSLDELERGA